MTRLREKAVIKKLKQQKFSQINKNIKSKSSLWYDTRHSINHLEFVFERGGGGVGGVGAVLSTKLNIPALINTCFFLYDGYLEQ